MWQKSKFYQRLDGMNERIDWANSGDQIIRYNGGSLSPILTQDEEILVLLDYTSYHQEPLDAWLCNQVSHGLAKVDRLKACYYKVGDEEKVYWQANLQTAQSGYDVVYQQLTIYSLEERMVGSSLAGNIITERYEMEYHHPSSHRLFRYRCQRQKR